MSEIYDNIDALVLQFVKDEVDDGQISTRQLIAACKHTGWTSKQVKDSLSKQKELGLINQKSNTRRWYVVKSI